MSVTARREVSFGWGEGGQFGRKKVCVYWLEGRCTRNPCRFLHKQLPSPQSKSNTGLARPDNQKPKSTWKIPNLGQSKNEGVKKCLGGKQSNQGTQKRSPTTEGAATCESTSPKKVKICQTSQKSQAKICQTSQKIPEKICQTSQKSQPKICQTSQNSQAKICQYWLTDNCVHGDKCRDSHSYFSGSGFSMLTILDGHTKAVTGIALPSGSDKLYSGSIDGSVRVWDCHSGQSVGVVKLDSEVCCLISEGQWLFAGLRSSVKVWNLQHQTEFLLNGIVGRVCSMVVSKDMIFAGVEGGLIYAWKFCSDQCSPELAGSLNGHDGDVVALVVGANNRLYSGSKDNTVKVWDYQHMQCLHTLHGHSSDVTSVLCWEDYLLSGSLDNTIKVWAATESGTLEVVYEHREETGILSLCGINDAEAKPILLCSCKGNTMKLIELPSLAERGRIFGKRDIQTVQIGYGGLFFSGDETGKVFVWKLDEARS